MEELNPLQWAVRPLKRYADFNGRAPRAEYWWYSLFGSVVAIIVAFIDYFAFEPIFRSEGPLGLLLLLAMLIPGVAVTVRRLHDINRSGWWYLMNVWSFAFLIAGSVRQSFERLPTGAGFVIILAMIACLIVFFVFMITPGAEGPNRYGPDPYGPDSLEEVFA